ncbi:MAG: helix-turn-helix transcriptional regulator [Planctomycetota bacterium]|nr:helix-turn-helix transcriptional regulator [Planctomycetota bacterium]
MSSKQPKHFGELLREKRLAKKCSLRKFAELVEVSPTYLSLVEQGKVERPPTAARVQKMAEILGENPDEFLALAGRLPQDLAGIIQEEPKGMATFLREARGLTAEQLGRLTEQARRLKAKDDKK